MNPFDDLVPGSKPDGANPFDDLVPKTTIGGLARTAAASGIDNVGSLMQGGGEILAKLANTVGDTQRFTAVNPLKFATNYIKDGMSEGDKLAAQDSFKGDVLKPETWELPKTIGGAGHAIAQGLGSVGPTIITALAARGRPIPAMAAQGGLMTGGAAAGDIRENFDKLDTDEKLSAASPAFAQLVAGGMSPADARAKITNESAQYGGLISGLAGAAGGAFNAKLLEDLIAKKGIPALLGKSLAERGLARTATGAAVGAVGEGLQEGLEKVGQNAGENLGLGKSIGDDVTRDTFGDVVGGALVGKITGGVGGALSKPANIAIAPDGAVINADAGPISRAAATAINTGAAQQKTDQKTAETVAQQEQQQQAEAQQQQDAQAKAFTGKPQFDDPSKWWEALNGAGQTALVEKLDGEERQTALELMATARDPRTSDPIREKAAGMLYGIAQNIGLPGTVAPVSPLALPAPTKEANPISGLLPSPDTPRSGTLIAGKDGVRQQTYGDLDTTANRAISEATASLGNPNPQPAQTIRNAEPTSDVSTKVQPGALEGEYIRGRQAAEQYFPFKNAQQAEARAMAATKEFGEEYGVEPHPSVKGAFAVVPASKAQKQLSAPVDSGKRAATSTVENDNTSNGGIAGTSSVVTRKEPLQQSEGQRVSSVRSAGNKNGSGVAGKLPSVFRGDGPASIIDPLTGSQGRQQGLRTGQRALGDKGTASAESSGIRASTDVQRQDADRGGVGAGTENSRINSVQPDSAGAANGASLGADSTAKGRSVVGADSRREVQLAQGVGPRSGPESDNAAGTSQARVASGKGVDDATVDDAAHVAATSPRNELPEPTEAQQRAGNYQLGHTRIAGLDISIENPSGSTRSGVDADGKAWNTTMRDHYGYIKRTTGADKDQVGVFIKGGTKPDHSGDVYVIDQVNPKTGSFDETKAMIGFKNQLAAAAAYRAHYDKGWKGMGAITPMPINEFKSWVKSPEAAKPLALENKPNDGIPQPVAPTVRDERPPSDSAAAPDKPTGTPDSKARSVIGANKRARVAATDVADSAASVADAGQSQGNGAGVATSPEIVALRTRASVLKSLKACLG